MDIRARLRSLFHGNASVAPIATQTPVIVRHGLDAEAQSKFLAQFDPDGARWQGNIAPYIGQYAKQSIGIEDRGDYSVYLINRGPSCYGLAWHNINFGVVYFDASRSVVLCKGNLALAVAGFRLYDIAKDIDGAYALIVQLQGATLGERSDGRHDERRLELAKLRWERLLVAFLRDQLFANGFDELRMRRAEENSYYDHGDERHFSQWKIALNERLRMRYNVTAERMGFKLMHPDDESFVLRKKQTDSG